MNLKQENKHLRGCLETADVMQQAAQQHGKQQAERIAEFSRAIGPLKAENAKLRSVLERLTAEVSHATSFKHAGGVVTAEEWGNLWQLANEAKAVLSGSGCQHNSMVKNDEPGFTWKCADCGYVYGKAQ